jgi:hypothetical protein
MPRFYLHLCAPGQVFKDDIGSDLSSLSAAHTRALLLANRVMTFFDFADRTSDFRRWTVEITDDEQHPLMTVKFPAHLARGEQNSVPSRGARMLLAQLEAVLETSPRPVPAADGNFAPRRVRTRPAKRGRAQAHQAFADGA